jgi:hypothetical protein
MQQDEFKFMLEKLATSLGATLSIRKTILLEIVRITETRIVPEKEQIFEKEFLQVMVPVMKEFTARLADIITERITVFSDCVAKERLPAYLKPGNNFLGK